MTTTLIKNATIVNEGKIFQSDIFLQNGIIQEISENIECNADNIIDATGKHLIPGVIDDQVHFREPGLTHKAEIDSVRVFINGSLNHDWLYIESENTVYFTTIPSAGELVEVGYRYIESDTGT